MVFLLKRVRGNARWLLALLLLGLAGTLIALALSWQPEIAPIAAPSARRFATEQVARGAVLAKLGDCAVCHIREGGARLPGAVRWRRRSAHCTRITSRPIRRPASALGRPRRFAGR